jgi:uncharacterized protein involved in type VI secretion and phage assembly
METDLLDALMAGNRGLNRFYGVVVGVVSNNQDPDNMHRVKVKFPWLADDVESDWARVATPMAGNDRGIYCLPEVDDEVLVAFEHGCIDHPFVVGALWNGKDSPPESNQDGENNIRVIKSRSGHVVRLNDKQGDESVEIIDQSGNNRIVIKSSDNSILIETQGDITIRSSTGKLSLTGNGIELKSQAAVSVEAAQTMDLKAGAQVTVKGAVINLN